MSQVETLSRDETASEVPDLICFCHLRWDFVTQRPQHLMSRFSKTGRVFFWEEPILTDHHLPYYEIHGFEGTTVKAIRPRLPRSLHIDEHDAVLADLLKKFCALANIERPTVWLYSPMFWPCAKDIPASLIVYDCMDQLSSFRFAPADLAEREKALMAAADLVLTGGQSLWEEKRNDHDNIHCFPSSVDVEHFRSARDAKSDPADQIDIPHPRLGYFGVIDERIDLELIEVIARERPQWSIIMLGPVVKVDPAELPKATNLHWLGQKPYHDLPAYLASWDLAIMPFAINDATRFISPTKTPEYLAAGRPVVSTNIRDVARTYCELRSVSIANTADDFIKACEASLAFDAPTISVNLSQADEFLSTMSWDESHRRIVQLMESARRAKRAPKRISRTYAPFQRHKTRSYDITICGAGFAGSCLARLLAEESGQRVLLIDKREHIGGNAYDFYDDAGVLVHKYGPHIFHTNSAEVFDYLSRFTEWRPYSHRVLAEVGDQLVPMPINRTTINQLYELDLQSEEAAAAFFAARAEPVESIVSSRDVVISAIGRELYQTFFEGYTRKQWGLDPSDLDKSVTSRVPTRTNTDDRYFTDRYQYMPRDGYTKMFESMLEHPAIDVALSTEFDDIDPKDRGQLTIYTGPIDAFYGYRYGKLPYRSLKFVHETRPQRKVLPVGVVNFPSQQVPYTRITEYKHLTGQVHPHSSISYEFPCSDGDPYYPIPRPENQELFRKYDALAREEKNVIFAGRLGSYRYYNMDQVVGQALSIHRRLAPKFARTDDELSVRVARAT